MTEEKLRRACYIMLAIVLSVVIGYFGLKYALPVMLPFIIAWAIAFAIRPLSRRIGKVTKIPEKIISPIISVLIILLLFFGIFALGVTIVSEGFSLVGEFISGGEGEKILSIIVNPFGGNFFGKLPPEILSQLKASLDGFLSGIASHFAGFLASAIGGIPNFILFLVITIIATVYFCADLENINTFVIKILPKSVGGFLIKFKSGTFSVFLKYLRSYLILMLITFMIMLVGFLFLGVKYAVLIAGIVALLDALPVLGVGTVLVPYSIVALMRGQTSLAIGIIVLFITHEVIRQFAEPKILGKNLGMHPLPTIIMLYVGYSLLGILGIVLLPLFVVIVNVLVEKPKSAKVE